MNQVYSVEQVRQLEQRWAEQHQGTTWPLMVAAAQSFVRQYLQAMGPGAVLVIAGNGNNGGDGYVIARLLKEAGLQVDVYAPLGAPNADIDAFRAFTDFQVAGGELLSELPARAYASIVDALFGIGLSRSITGELANLISWVNRQTAKVFAVDIPSGLDASNGQILGCAVQATACHTFIGYKPGLLTHDGPQCCGLLSMDDLDAKGESTWLLDESIGLLPVRKGNTHKARQGDVRIVGGRLHMAGAALIAGKAALNSGAGRVFLHCDSELAGHALASTPELMLAGSFTSHHHRESTTYVLGPGLGLDEIATHLVSTIANLIGAKGVMDADALTLLAKKPKAVSHWVLTPHEGEAARLLGVDAAEVQADRVAAAQQLAETYQTTVVLKGAGTLVAKPGTMVFCHAGTPAMATPGMGDCLAGMIGALMAQGLSPFEASVSAVNWHARIGANLAARQRVVLASDVVAELRFLPDSD